MKYNKLNLGQIEAIINKLGGMEGVEAFLRGQVEIVIKSIINWLGTVTIPATTEKFVATEKFDKNSKEVKFYGIWDDFNNWFLSGNGKIEDPIDETTLRYGKLTKSSVDELIIEELGGVEKAETTLQELWNLLKRQANGEEGVLLTNGYANIFYIIDTPGVLRAVSVRWHVDGWHVDAISVGNLRAWTVDRLVFSRNC